MLCQFTQNVVDSLNAAQAGAWAPPICNDQGPRPWTKIFKQAWYPGNNGVHSFIEIRCAKNGQHGMPPYNIVVTLGKRHSGMTPVRFANQANPAPTDVQAVAQCVAFAIQNANRIAALPPGGGPLPVAPLPANAVPPRVQISRLQRPDPFKEIVLATDHMHNVVKPIENQLGIPSVPNHFLCRIVYEKREGDKAEIMFNGAKPRFNLNEAREIGNVDQSRVKTQNLPFSQHDYFKRFREVFHFINFRFPDEQLLNHNPLAIFTDSLCFVAADEVTAIAAYETTPAIRKHAIEMYDMHLNYYKPRIVVNYGALAHEHLLPDYFRTFGLPEISTQQTADGRYKRFDSFIGNTEIVFLSTAAFIPATPGRRANDWDQMVQFLENDLTQLATGGRIKKALKVLFRRLGL